MSSSASAPLVTARPMGIENEYGVIHADGAARSGAGVSSSVLLSHLVVDAYALLGGDPERRGRRIRWDYGDETPLRDARGFELTRAAAHPTQLTDETADAHVPSIDMDEPLLAPERAPDGDDATILRWAVRRSIGNAVLPNGARLYVDHAHPEYSAPEVMTAREGVQYDRAGDEIAVEAMRRIDGIAAEHPDIPAVALFKNNTDSKGASYGTHENYLLDREIPFPRVVEALLPFFASRIVLVGAGRVGLGTRGEEAGFQLSSRADFFEAEVGLETTLNRPIVNSRDEPHADGERFRRLHVIVGDGNRYETGTFLKLGMTSLVLAALEAEQRTGEAILPRIALEDPVAALHAISHDPSLTATVPTADGGELTGLQIQRAHLDAIAAHADFDDPETAEVVGLWGELLDLLETDRDAAADRVEWLGKLTLLEGYRARHGLDWDDPRLLAIDLQWTDLRPSSSLYERLRRAGRARTIVDQADVERAVTVPPASTRAHLRGTLASVHPSAVPSAGWDVITLADETGGSRIRLADPALGSEAWCRENRIDLHAPVPEILEDLQRAFTNEERS